VWLLQEGERVSSYRLIRVRATQPFSSTASGHRMNVAQHSEDTSIVDGKIQIGELCVFKSEVGSKLVKYYNFPSARAKGLKTKNIKDFLLI